jgi:hypothetical protein
MKPQDQSLKFVRWEEDDQLYVGCIQICSLGAASARPTSEEAFRGLCQLVEVEVNDLTTQE